MASTNHEDPDPYATLNDEDGQLSGRNPNENLPPPPPPPRHRYFRPGTPGSTLSLQFARSFNDRMYPYSDINVGDHSDTSHTMTSTGSVSEEGSSSSALEQYSLTDYDQGKKQEIAVRRARDKFDTLSPCLQSQKWRSLKTEVFPSFMPDRPDQLALFLKVKDEWVHNEALMRLFFLCLSPEGNTQVAYLWTAEVEVWSILSQNTSLPNRCHVIALHALLWTRLWSQQGELGGERHRRRWQEISAHQQPLDNGEDEALKDFLHFLDVNSSNNEGGLRWTLQELYVKLCELAKSQTQQTATDAVELIRAHPQRTGQGFFLLHLALVNAVNSMLLITESIGYIDWTATHAEPLMQYLEDSLRKEDIRVPHHQRQVLLDVLRPHAFHRNRKVRCCLVQLLQDPYQKDRLPDQVEEDKAEKEMTASRLKIHKVFRVPGVGKGCQWREMRGQADGDSGRMEVRVHFYSHTLDCLKRESSDRCTEAGPLVRAFDIRHSLDARPFLQHEEHDLAKLYVQATHASQEQLIRRVLEQRQNSVDEARRQFMDWIMQVVQALEYLHGKGIVLVDLSAHSLVLHESRVKVVNFDSALRWKTDKTASVETMPMRWLAPESLLEGRFSPASDVLALGRLLYQICTGGLEPYGELYTADTGIVLHAVANCAPLHAWNCIPTRIYDVIKSCNAPEADRLPLLSVFKNSLQRFKAALDQSQNMNSAQWPELDVHQIARDHVPEKAKSQQIDQLRREHRLGYQNVGPSRLDKRALHPDWESLTIVKEADGTVVTEPMTMVFVDQWWPRLRDLHVAELGRLPECAQPEVFHQYKKGRQRRHYPASRTMQEETEAFRSEVSPSERAEQMLLLLLQLAEALERLHADGWVYRDLSPHTVLVTLSDRQILFHRLGKMRMYRRHENDTTYKYTYIQEYCDQSRLPPETQRYKEYGPDSEVFVFAVTAWEVLETLKPTKNASTEGVRGKPALCHEVVFQLLQSCWRKKDHRPTMNHVATELRKILSTMRLVSPRMVPPTSQSVSGDPPSLSSSSSSYLEVTEYRPVSAAHFPRQGRVSFPSEGSRIGRLEGSTSSWLFESSSHDSNDDHGGSEIVHNRSNSGMSSFFSVPNVNLASLGNRDAQRQPSPRPRSHMSRENAQASANHPSPRESGEDSAAESDRHHMPLPPPRSRRHQRRPNIPKFQ